MKYIRAFRVMKVRQLVIARVILPLLQNLATNVTNPVSPFVFDFDAFVKLDPTCSSSSHQTIEGA
jgi:hypothetical protein